MVRGWWPDKRGGERPGEGELTAAQALTRELLPVAGNTLTGDALYCQRDYCQQIRDAGGDYLVIVKKNQRELYDDIALAFAVPVAEDDCYRKTATCHQHGDRWEIRELAATDELNDYLNWPDVGQVCRITRRTLRRDQATGEARYVITSLDGKGRAGGPATVRARTLGD